MVAPEIRVSRETYARFYDEFASAVNLTFRAIARLHLQRHSRNSLSVCIVKQLNRNAIVLSRATTAIVGGAFVEQNARAMKRKNGRDLVFEESCETPFEARKESVFISAKDGDRILYRR